MGGQALNTLTPRGEQHGAKGEDPRVSESFFKLWARVWVSFWTIEYSGLVNGLVIRPFN